MAALRDINDVLDDLLALLSQCGETFWRSKLSSTKKKDVNAQKRDVMAWFGGMGSFGDLIISKYNGHSVDESDESKLNDVLDSLRNELYQLAARKS